LPHVQSLPQAHSVAQAQFVPHAQSDSATNAVTVAHALEQPFAQAACAAAVQGVAAVVWQPVVSQRVDVQPVVWHWAVWQLEEEAVVEVQTGVAQDAPATL
jgi:hypothetical protein